jgi:type I restriction enzyme S subunit
MAKLDIPESWAECTLKDVAKWGSGGTPSRANKKFFGGNIPWIKTGDLPDGDLLHFDEGITEDGLANISGGIYPKDTIVMAMYGATIGKLGRLTFDAAVNQACACAITHQGVFNWFLFYWLRSNRQKYIDAGRGGGQPNISRELIYEQPFVLPPLAEQKRIVAKIESTTAKIDAIEKAVTEAEALLEKYRESLLAKAFRGELVPQDPNDEPASKLLERIRAERAKQQTGKGKKANELRPISEDEIPFEIPKSWEWVRLGELESLGIFSLIEDGNHGELHPKAKDYVSDGIAFVMANNIRNGSVNLDNCKKLPPSITDKLRIGFAKTGDVLLTHKGTIGEVGIVPEVSPYIMLTPQVTMYRIANAEVISNTFLKIIFSSPFFQYSIKSVSKQATRDYVGITRQKELIVPLPPAREQFRIAHVITDALNRSERVSLHFSRGSDFCEKLRSSLLDSAFSGRLVPQDPLEGTGHDLLAEIFTIKKSEPDDKTSAKKLHSSLVQP